MLPVMLASGRRMTQYHTNPLRPFPVPGRAFGQGKILKRGETPVIIGFCQSIRHVWHTRYALTSPERGPTSIAHFYSSDSQPQNGVRNKLSLIEVRGEMGPGGIAVGDRCAMVGHM